MAVTSGQVNTNTTYESFFWVRWSQKSQNIAENYTIINWSCGVTPGHKFGDNAIKMSAVTINGVQVYAGGKYSDFLDYKEHTLGSGELKISHNTDGKKTFTISSFTGWLYSNHNYSSAGASYELPTIPRQATITAAPNFTDLENPTITYNNQAGNSVTDLKACISFTGAKDDIAYRNIAKTGGTSNTGLTYQFPLTDAERDVLRNNTGIEREVIFYVRSVIGGVTYYSTLKRKLTIAQSEATKPTLSITSLSPVSNLAAQFDGLYIQGKSKVKAELEVGAKYGATVETSTITVEGTNYSAPYESSVLTKSGTQSIRATVSDSRHFSRIVYQDINVIPYSKPLVIPISSENAIQCYRSDGNGNRTGNSTSLWIKAKLSYYDVEGKNTAGLQWRSRKASEEWPQYKEGWNLLFASWNGTSEFNGQVAGVFDLKEAYVVQIRAIDDIGEVDIKTFEIPTQDVALHLGEGGKNVAIGTYCDYSEERTFYSEWKAIFGGGVYIGDKTLKEYIQEVINGGG